MNFVVIENWDNLSSPQLVMDEEGNTKVFDNLSDAEVEAMDCQEGIVVPLAHVISTLRAVSDFIDAAKFELGEEDDNGLESEVNEYLK